MARERSPRLPDAIGIGMPRTGSTWLYDVLRDSVDMPAGVKDTHFFYRFANKGIEWYARHFRYATGDRKIVEICPGIFFSQSARELLKTSIPDCKIFVTMRDPVERTYSEYKMLRHYGNVRRGSFDYVLKTWTNLAGGNRYAPLLKAWFDSFGRENVLVTMYDELRAEPQKFVNRVTDFIGIDRIALAARPKISTEVNSFSRAPANGRLARRATRFEFWLKSHQAYRVDDLLDRAGAWKFCRGRGAPFPPLTAEQDALLRERYRPEVEALEDLLGVDLSAWKKPRAWRKLETVADSPLPILAHG